MAMYGFGDFEQNYAVRSPDFNASRDFPNERFVLTSERPSISGKEIFASTVLNNDESIATIFPEADERLSLQQSDYNERGSQRRDEHGSLKISNTNMKTRTEVYPSSDKFTNQHSIGRRRTLKPSNDHGNGFCDLGNVVETCVDKLSASRKMSNIFSNKSAKRRKSPNAESIDKQDYQENHMHREQRAMSPPFSASCSSKPMYLPFQSKLAKYGIEPLSAPASIFFLLLGAAFYYLIVTIDWSQFRKDFFLAITFSEAPTQFSKLFQRKGWFSVIPNLPDFSVLVFASFSLLGFLLLFGLMLLCESKLHVSRSSPSEKKKEKRPG